MAQGDSARGREALRALDFHVHLDHFMSPTAELADIVLPVTVAFESEGLKIGFEVSQEAESLVQLRTPLVSLVGEARADIAVIFDLAIRLGLGEQFFDGDVDAAWEYQLEPSGVTLEQLRTEPAGVRLPLETHHRKYAAPGDGGVPAGFDTPTGRIELYEEAFLDVGQPAIPTLTEPALSPRSRPDLAGDFPLVLSCAESLYSCETQHRQVAYLRRHASDPEVELHSETAASRGITEGQWVEVVTPKGAVRVRAVFNDSIAPGVVFGEHGWFEPCEELDLPGYPPFGPGSTNLNLMLGQTPSDAISGLSRPGVPGRTAWRGERRLTLPTVRTPRGRRSIDRRHELGQPRPGARGARIGPWSYEYRAYVADRLPPVGDHPHGDGSHCARPLLRNDQRAAAGRCRAWRCDRVDRGGNTAAGGGRSPPPAGQQLNPHRARGAQRGAQWAMNSRPLKRRVSGWSSWPRSISALRSRAWRATNSECVG